MKKINKLTEGITLNDMGYLVNRSGKRVNSKGEELVEVDAEAFMNAMETRIFSIVSFVIAGFALLVYIMILINNPESPPTRQESALFLGIFFAFFVLGILFVISGKWKHKLYKEPKFVVSLPKSAIENLTASDYIIGTVSNENTNLDTDGDGRILISEVYTLTEEEVLDKLLANDSNFTVLDFKDYVKSVFTLVQDGWSDNDYRSLRPYESDLLYVRHKLRIESMIEDNITNKRSHIRVKGVLLKDYCIEEEYETLVVALTAKMEVENSENMYMTKEGDYPYILKFVRKKGVKTNKKKHLSTGNCCNCGAAIDVDDNGVCKYCETSVVSGENEWILSDIRNIKIQGI